MGFQTLPVIEKTDAGKMKGIYSEVACGCWFTKYGRAIPKLIRAMDEAGEIHTFQVLESYSAETKRYSGIETVEHICKVNTTANQERIIKLIYRKDNCTWHMEIIN